MREEHSKVNGRHAVERAMRYLQERFSEPIRLDELSIATGLSRFHLVRAFTKQFGIPPHAYQIRLRIVRGRELLRAGIPIASIAAQLGFADQSHFTRHFKQALGITPTDYARGAG
jgi:AraC-like DNA-binding protein